MHEAVSVRSGLLLIGESQEMYINPSYCFGCGVCRATCKHQAIQLLSRQ